MHVTPIVVNVSQVSINITHSVAMTPALPVGTALGTTLRGRAASSAGRWAQALRGKQERECHPSVSGREHLPSGGELAAPRASSFTACQ